MSRDQPEQAFADAVAESFEPLTGTGALFGPELFEDGAHFYAPRFSVDVGFDWIDSAVTTVVTAQIDELHCRAPLRELYVKAGLGPARHVPVGARSLLDMRRSLRAQAAAVEALLPLLLGPHRDEVLTLYGR